MAPLCSTLRATYSRSALSYAIPGTESGVDVAEGGRTTAALAASHFGNVLMVSEDGMVSFFRGGHCVW